MYDRTCLDRVPMCGIAMWMNPLHRGARIKPPRLYIELNVTVVFRDTGVGRRGTAWTEDNPAADALGPPSDRSSRPALPPVWDSIKRLL